MKIQRKKTLKRISRRKSISRRRKRQSKPISRRKRYSRKMKGGNPFCGKYKTKIEQLKQTIELLKEEKLKPLEPAGIKEEDTYATLRTPPPAGYYAELLHTTSPTTPSFHTTPKAGPNAPFRMVMSPSRPELPRPRDIPKFNLEESSA